MPTEAQGSNYDDCNCEDLYMSIFGGTSFFGMATGSRGRHKRKRGYQSASNVREEETIEPGVAACESAPGELRRRTLQSGEEPRQKFSRMFAVNTAGSPRVGGIRKFTK